MGEKKNMLEEQKRKLEAEIEETGKLWTACQRTQEELRHEFEEVQKRVEELQTLLNKTQSENVLLRIEYEKLLFDKQDVERELSKL